jgi:hypothetical protein
MVGVNEPLSQWAMGLFTPMCLVHEKDREWLSSCVHALCPSQEDLGASLVVSQVVQ